MPAHAERMVKGVLETLRKRFPNMSIDELKSRAYAIVTKSYQEQGKPNPFHRK